MDIFKKNNIITSKRKQTVIASQLPADIQQISETEMMNLNFNGKGYKIFIDVENNIKNNDLIRDKNGKKYIVEDVEKDDTFGTFTTLIVDSFAN